MNDNLTINEYDEILNLFKYLHKNARTNHEKDIIERAMIIINKEALEYKIRKEEE